MELERSSPDPAAELRPDRATRGDGQPAVDRKERTWLALPCVPGPLRRQLVRHECQRGRAGQVERLLNTPRFSCV
jgi:hypothetical protein